MTQATLIFNPVAGQRDVRDDLHKVVGMLTEQGWQVTWRETTADLNATTVTQTAIKEGAEVVIAAGGDGTINEVMNGLVGHSDVRLGILPTGTANVWARESGIAPPFLLPMDLEAAGRILFEGESTLIDIGKVGERYFFLMVGIGFDALVTRKVDLELKDRVGAWAYAWSALQAARNYRGARVRVTVDGETFERVAWFVAVNNTRLYARVELAKEASVTDGLLDIIIFSGHSWRQIIRHGLAILMGQHIGDTRVEYLQGKVITVEAAPPLPYQVDAEPLHNTPVKIEVVPRALRVIHPKEVVL